MTDPARLLRQPGPRAAALLSGAALILALAAGLGRWLAPAPTPAPGLALRLAIPAEPAGPATRLALADEVALPALAPRAALPRVIAAPAPAPDLPAAARDEAAEPLVRRIARPAPAPAPVLGAPALGHVPAPPRRPGPALPAPAAAGDLATRLALPDGPSGPDLALGAIPPGGLIRSPVPPVRPRGARLAPAPSVAPGAVLAARLDPPPRRPAAVGRLAAPAATPALAALTAPAVTAPPVATAPEPGPLASRGSADGCGPALARAIPARGRSAAGGRAVLAALDGAGGTTRDSALVRAVSEGNVPDHLRRLVPVTMAGTMPDGRRAQITLCVMPDYLAVGSDQDFVRIPLGLPAANRLAERFDMVLPTARMVDAIHAQARVRLTPSPMTPGAQMASTAYLVSHNATVEAQRRATGAGLGHLVSGHKKDVVLTNRLAQVAGRVAIYGWHRANGQPIQPLSTVHGQNYADYSHGIRLISRTAFVGGRPVDLLDLLADRRYAAILTGDEGPIATRQILAALR